MDPYDILKIHRSASEKEIKNAYYKLAKEYHPDKNQQNPKWADIKMKELNSAYSTLIKKGKLKTNETIFIVVLFNNHNYFK